MNESVERSAHLDGLRGLAALTVFFGHLVLALFPAVVTENRSDVHTRLDLLMGLTPIAFVWNGNFGVCIFFVLSGYVLSHFCSHSRISFPAQLLRRYLRLALPILITSTFAWLLLVIGAYYNGPAAEITRSGWLQGWYRFDPNFFAMVKEALYDAFARGDHTYNPNIWTMQIELTGSIYVFILHSLFKNRQDRLVIIIIFASFHVDDYYILFASGAFLYDFRNELNRISGRGRDGVSKILMLIGAFLGSLTWVISPIGENWLSRHDAPKILHTLNQTFVLPVLRNAQPTLHEFGAVLLFIGLLSSAKLRQLFGTPFLAYLGKISFVLYLIHIPIICSATSLLIFYLPPEIPYLIRAVFAALVSIGLVFAISIGINDFVDVRTTALSRRAGNWFDRFFVGEANPSVSWTAVPSRHEGGRANRDGRTADAPQKPLGGSTGLMSPKSAAEPENAV